jgi:hypothetical protein
MTTKFQARRLLGSLAQVPYTSSFGGFWQQFLSSTRVSYPSDGPDHFSERVPLVRA